MFFATNMEREHYPAFALVDHGSLQVDEYLGFHADIFQHTDGHSYIGNNVAAAFLAAIPLFVFDPVLDRIEDYSKSKLDDDAAEPVELRTYDHRPNAKAFFELAYSRGLDLRFGATAGVTTAFLMAPLSALMVALMFLVLRWRGVSTGRATALAFLFGFATPIWFRTSALSHNLVQMATVFGSFLVLWMRPDSSALPSARRLMISGALAGFALAVDYSGAALLLPLYGYAWLTRVSTQGWVRSFRDSLWFVAGSVPPVLFLLFTQWWMFDNPFLPGQYWMPDVNYTDEGWRGFSWPAVDLFFQNLFELEWGMYPFAPLLLFGLIPAVRYGNERILPGPERWFVIGLLASFLLFCAANQYSRMQWNTGFRYLLPLVPFVFLQASDHLARLPAKWLAAVAALVLVNSWVIASVREAVDFSWGVFLREGPKLPWLTILSQAQPAGSPLAHPLFPAALTACGAAFAYALWRWTARLEQGRAT